MMLVKTGLQSSQEHIALLVSSNVQKHWQISWFNLYIILCLHPHIEGSLFRHHITDLYAGYTNSIQEKLQERFAHIPTHSIGLDKIINLAAGGWYKKCIMYRVIHTPTNIYNYIVTTWLMFNFFKCDNGVQTKDTVGSKCELRTLLTATNAITTLKSVTVAYWLMGLAGSKLLYKSQLMLTFYDHL